jgi:hypothetical protein
LSGHFPFAFAAPREMPEAQRKEVMQLFSALSPRKQAVALGCIQELLARGALMKCRRRTASRWRPTQEG